MPLKKQKLEQIIELNTVLKLQEIQIKIRIYIFVDKNVGDFSDEDKGYLGTSRERFAHLSFKASFVPCL